MSWFIKKKRSFVCQIKRRIFNDTVVAVAGCLAAATSCVKDVMLDALEEPKMVVECILTDAPVQTLYLTYTKGASRAQAPDLPEATAVLTDLTEGKEAGRFTRAADGSWQLAYGAIPEHRYRLDVTVPGHDPVWAEQTMPAAPGIAVGWVPWTGDADNPSDYSRDQGYVFSLTSTKNPVWFYGINYPSRESPGEVASHLCTDYSGVDTFNETGTFYSEAVGASAFGSDWLSTSFYPDLVGAPLHRRFLRFPAQVDSTGFLVSGSLQGYIGDHQDFIHAEFRPAELHYFSASEDYDRFLLDGEKLLAAKTSSNLADIFLRENVYTNIQGAIGLFGAAIEKSLAWESKEGWGKNGYFLLSGFREVEELESGYQYPPAVKDYHYHVSKGFLSPVPFELLCYELISDPSVFQDYGITAAEESTRVIRSMEELSDVGLEGYGPVDFSKQEVFLYTYNYPYGPSTSVPSLSVAPTLIGCAMGTDELDPLDFYPPYYATDRLFFYLRLVESLGHFAPVSTCRIAIILDKQEYNDIMVDKSVLPVWTLPKEDELLGLVLKDLVKTSH